MKRVVALLLAAALAFWAVPVVSPDDPFGTLLLDGRGRVVDARIAADEQWRFEGHDVPERFATALTVAEDKRFWWHPGIDPVAIGRAMGSNLAAGRVVSGASTLTMQVIRISRHNPARTLPEKALEAVLALRLEAAHDKRTILAMYAQYAPFGGNTVGVEAAAWRYFGRPAGELSWAEAATLAVLPNSPGLIHPGRARDALKAKRDGLLDDLAAEGHLDETDLELAKLEPLPGRARRLPKLALHLLQQVYVGTHATTLDLGLQRRAMEVAGRHQDRLAGNLIHGLAAVVIDVPTGEVRAYIGNAPELGAAEHGHHVDVVQAPRSPGSTLKPFLYQAMLEHGELLPHQLVPDVPMRFGGFAPKNFDLGYQGALPAAQALARSRNVPAVWMLQQHGVDRFYGELQALGMTTLHRDASDYGLSLILGGSEATLWELTTMYRQLALAALELEAPVTHWRPTEELSALTRMDAGASWSTLEALLEVNRPGVHGVWRDLAGGRRIAWKTGTSVGFRDGWAIGVTPQTAIGVWVGNADGEGRPDLTGFQAAAPLLFDLFDLVETGGWFERPGTMALVDVCVDSGMRAGPDCPHTREAWVPPEALKATGCGWCERIHLEGDERVHAGCATGEMRAEPWFVLPPHMETHYARHHGGYEPLPPWSKSCDVDADDALSIVHPRQGAKILVPTELDGSVGRVVFEADHRDPRAELHWHIDDAYVATTTHLHQVEVAPLPGTHRLTVVDAAGGRVSRRFEVLE